MENDDVMIGKKPTMSYVLAVLTHLNSGHQKVNLRARGVTISKAVDISQIIKNRFMKDIKIGRVDIGSEELTEKDGENKGKKRNVSFISIELVR